MAAVVEPLPPVAPWWPASRRVVTEEAASAVLACLERLRGFCFIGRLRVSAVVESKVQLPNREHIAQRLLPFVDLHRLQARGIRVGKILNECSSRYGRHDSSWDPVLLFTCVSARPMEEVTAEVLKHCREEIAQRWGKSSRSGDRESWRRADGRDSRVVVTGDPLAMDVISGPHGTVLAGWGADMEMDAGFEVDFHTSFQQAAESTGAAQLLQLLELGCGDVGVLAKGKVSALHLAALTGHPAVVAAIVERVAAATAGVGSPLWQDADGRTPLHCAAFFDSAELVEPLLRTCDATARDRCGRTALEVAEDLQHYATARVLQGRPRSLNELCGQKLRSMLRSGAADLGTIPPGQLSDLIPLHDYRAWGNLAATQGGVDPSIVLRSMSCFECWYGDILSKQCGPTLPSHMELIRVWDDLASFRTPWAAAAAKPDVAVLAEAMGSWKAPTVADRATFLERFHRRTGGVFQDFDWRNLLVIGGMVLACFIADDDEYARDFKGTDVDIYVVGAEVPANVPAGRQDACGEGDPSEDNNSDGSFRSFRGRVPSAFHRRVLRVMAALPDSEGGEDYTVEISGETLQKHGGDPGVHFDRDTARNRLVLTGKSAALAEECDSIQVGDFIVGVNYEDDMEDMVKELASRETFKRGGVEMFEGKELVVRPASSEAAPAYASVVRTPQTLTASIRQQSGEALPNVQVVLAPYSSPAHLLFTTDIDCTAMGFDGDQLYATPRAREAIRLRQNIARPEKYTIRGEWRTEARLLKYAARGFRVVDLGLHPHAVPVANEEVARISQAAQPRRSPERYVRQLQDTGVHGAQLLMLAGRDDNLKRLLLHEEPLLRPGMSRGRLVNLVGKSCTSSHRRRQGEARGASSNSREKLVEYNDGYGKASAKLVLVNPQKPGRERIGDRELRGYEISLGEAIVELDLEVDRFEVRGWYEGMAPGDLRGEHAELETAAWKGLGDFRRAD